MDALVERAMKTLWLISVGDDEPAPMGGLLRDLGASGIRAYHDEVEVSDLWERLAEPMQDPALDALGVVLTPGVLGDAEAREEVAFALHQIRQERGPEFPVVTLLQAVPPSRVPPALRGSAVVSLSSPTWKEELVGWLNGDVPQPQAANAQYRMVIHREIGGQKGLHAIELGPAGGSMKHWRFGIPAGFVGLSAWGLATPGGIKSREAVTYQDREELVTGLLRVYEGVRYEFAGCSDEIGSKKSLYLVFRGELPKRIALAGAHWPDGEPVVDIEHWKLDAAK